MKIAQSLLRWYDRHHRVLPWRITPEQSAKGVKADPYKVWMSEVMLQQTTVEAVKAYFLKFTQNWPTIEDLAAADDDDIMRAWAGLGYYSRARNLKKCAELVVSQHDGRFPINAAELKKLPGIGDYTSAAIAAIAFNQPEAVVDGNVERVVTRLYALTTALPQAKAQIRELTAAITPEDRPGDFAQAMMDLGATICTPKRPACALCPLNNDCLALKSHDPEHFPVKAPKKERPVRLGAAFVAEANDGSILLRKRTEKGLLQNMAEVPGSVWNSRIDGSTDLSAAPFPADWRNAGMITHIFTHFELHLTVYHTTGADKRQVNDGWWSAADALNGEALPTVMKKAIAEAIPNSFKIRRPTK
ncbi:A/G-specific adenine glycosylase [Paenochrobactrum sp. BZR 588]|uniref:A/G-specific adenine glycosylase n=1 Tax=unclassified Paenochrobactrum TaxID=2639760 RepID=UPI003852AC37